jgi:hypothetical protein
MLLTHSSSSTNPTWSQSIYCSHLEIIFPIYLGSMNSWGFSSSWELAGHRISHASLVECGWVPFFLCQSSLPPFYRSFTRLECFALGPFYGPKPSVHLQFLTCSLWETLKRVIFHRHHFSARRFAIRYASHIGRPHPPCHAIAPSRDPQHLRHVRQARPGTQERFEDPAWGSCWYFFRWIQQVHTHVYTCTYIYICAMRYKYIYTHVLYLSVYASLFVYLSLHRHIYISIHIYIYMYLLYTCMIIYVQMMISTL